VLLVLPSCEATRSTVLDQHHSEGPAVELR